MTHRGRRSPLRRAAAWASLCGLVVAVVVAWTVTIVHPPAVTSPSHPRPAGRAARSSGRSDHSAQAVQAAAPVATGVYAGPGAVAAAVAADQRLGDGLQYALDFLSGSSWATITEPTWLAAQWRGGPFDLVLGVPMLPSSGATLAQGAAGTYDGEYSLLAQRLVQDGLGSAVLMIGWDPASSSQPWYAGTPAAARDYVRYWDDIRQVMAAVPGAGFTYEWVVGGDTSPVSPAAMYPGSAAVDLVGAVVFDRLPAKAAVGTRWLAVLGQPGGPAWAASFARAAGRPLAVAMWGVVPAGTGGGGDDGQFVTKLLAWEGAQHVRMSILWDYGSWALTGGTFPVAEAAFANAVVSPDAPVPATAAVRTGALRRSVRVGRVTDGAGTGDPYGMGSREWDGAPAPGSRRLNGEIGRTWQTT